VVACPKGEFQDDYGMFTACKSCLDVVGEGVTTPNVGSTTAADCKWAEPGYMLLDSGGKAVFSVAGTAVTPIKVTGARPCPQGYFCLGGDPASNKNIDLTSGESLTSKAPGIPQSCSDRSSGLTTAEEGAFSVEQCVAPPGKYGDLATAVADCPSGTYKETYARAKTPAEGCLPCGTGLWLSEKNFKISSTDLYGQLLTQTDVRGSPASCYIQQGMGTERTLTNGAVKAVICPSNTYGVVATKYGVVHSPCTACPTNMVTGYPITDVKAADIDYHVGSGTGLTATELFAITAEPVATITTAAGAASASGSGTGYYSVKACLNRPGFGYYNGASQKCPQGFYNAAGTDTPCSQCPPGTTTNGTGTGTDQDAADDCGMLAAGYTLNGITDKSPVLCPVGTYSDGGDLIASIVTQAQVDLLCTSCPTSQWTLEPGATSDADCTLCAPGFGKATGATTCAECGAGTYGSVARSTTPCETCPEPTRTFTYAWPSDNVDVYTPAVTSPNLAKGLEDCLADFSQIVNGAFSLDLVDAVGVYEPAEAADANRILSLQACVAACATDSECAAATFDYYVALEGTGTGSCKLWTPATGSSISEGGVALKTMPAYNLALGKDDTATKKDLGSGYFAMWIGSDAADALNPDSLVNVSAKSTIQECYDACTADNECAGVVFQDATAVAIGCKLIKAVIQPGDSKRTLVKAVVSRLTTTACPAGDRRKADGSSCEACPAGQYWDETWNYGYSCKVCNSPNVVSADRTKCQDATTTCDAGKQYNPAKPNECQPCPSGTYKAVNDAGSPAKCEACDYTVSLDRTKCQKPAACSRGFEWAVEQPGHCVPCEKDNFFKDTADFNETEVTKCQLCPSVGTGKFQNTVGSGGGAPYAKENCLNNCDGGYAYDDSTTASRQDPTLCTKCPWPLVKAGPAPTQCMGVCDVIGTTAEGARTTPNSDRTKCIIPVICPRGMEFDKNFPEDISKCKNCPVGYQNDDGVWLCRVKADGTNATGTCDSGTEMNPNLLGSCLTCPLPMYKLDGADAADTCPETCGAFDPTATKDTATNSVVVTDIGRNKDQFTYNNLLCQKQCGVDKFYNTATEACENCVNNGAIDGEVRPHGSSTRDACTACTGGKVAYMGYCVTPIICPKNTEYTIAKPLDVDACTPCAAGTLNADGTGRCA
jgi:hypothetical protein